MSRNMEADYRRLRQRLAVLTREASVNETKLRHFQDLEFRMLTTESLSELLRLMSEGMRATFALDGVRLLLWDSDHTMRYLLINAGERLERFEGVSFVDDARVFPPALTRLREARLGPYLASEHLQLMAGIPDLRSVALLPLRRGEESLGVICLGSRDPLRYTRHHATDFLAHLAGVIVVCLENAVNRERLRLTGLTDILTGLPNRRHLEARLGEELVRSQREGQALSCLFLDVDHFKRVNDLHGHAAGDRALHEVAQRMKAEVRASDVVARYGGEEFAMLLPHTALDAAARLGERIRARVAATPVPLDADRTLPVTLSVGVAQVLPPPGSAPLEPLGQALLRAADQALYRAKAGGRNRVVVQA